jgi:hypothetical protein
MFADTYHESIEDALAETARRRSDPTGREFVTKIEPSSYGGYRVRSLPADFFIDQLADGPTTSGVPFGVWFDAWDVT